MQTVMPPIKTITGEVRGHKASLSGRALRVSNLHYNLKGSEDKECFLTKVKGGETL